MQLTKRQCEVADRLVLGMTIAVIAHDLGLTESRVNQIIRALKNRFDVDTQAGIVAAYQQALEAGAIEPSGSDEQEDDAAVGGETLVPDLLNAPHPILYRLVAICLAAFVLAATFLMLTQFALLMSDATRKDGDAPASHSGAGAND